MKILIVSRAFYPMNSPRSFRTTELAKEFARQGHKVTVIAPKDKEQEAFAKKHNLEIIDLGKKRWKDIELKGSGVVLKMRRILRRGLKLILEYPDIEYLFQVKKALRKQKNTHYDLLISVAVPHPIHWGVAAAWKKKGNIADTWIADCGDPYMGGENDTFKPMFYFKYVEKWFCRKADFITVPVKTAIEAYYPEFHPKIEVISQGFNFDEIITSTEISDGPPHFAYAGSIIPGRRDPADFFEFLIAYPHPYIFDIYSANHHLLKSYAERSDGRIRIKEYLPRKELLFELSKLNFVVNFDNAGKRQIPSKIIDYVIVEKPILSINTKVFDKKTTLEFLQGNYTNGLQIDNPEQYKIENVTKKFLLLASQ